MASARAWALNRLADRYPSAAVAALGDDPRRKVQVLLADHVTALREDLSSLQNQLGEILSQSSNTPSANTSLTEPILSGSPAARETSADWRNRVRRIHSSTEAVHEAVATLLTSSQPGSDAEAIEVNLRTTLTQLQTELQLLDQKIRRTNLQ
jgi:peptidoglycan hydrolase CwlO-like protein